ncbi:MAG: rRNA maturation RNase YbeY [Pseudomonadota bacterium]
MVRLRVANEQGTVKINQARLRRKTGRILDALGCPEGELSLVLTDDDGISRLNRDYLGRVGPTNVISFPMREGEFADPQDSLLGDVVISVETAAREAAGAGLEFMECFDRLLIHGILHLFGYDHERPGSDATAMEARESELMSLLTLDSGD